MSGRLPSVLTNAARALPLFPLELAVRRLFANVMEARPSIVGRLGEHGGCRFAVDPLDCPFAFVITPRDEHSPIRVVRDHSTAACDARIAAPLLMLLGMLDGTYDGDALFFSRDLVIDGDTGAVLALRNAIENAELDPSTVLGMPKPLRDPFNRAIELLLDRLRRTLDAPKPSGLGSKAYLT
ncbi:MAG: SCP2 sterol-binding domain-containing protein [Alphaproteobacteria bacterium]|nr:SCP2 sterol-binding domain-containing protein [Alphaproteobacteria bacterium]